MFLRKIERGSYGKLRQINSLAPRFGMPMALRTWASSVAAAATGDDASVRWLNAPPEMRD